MFNNNPNNNNNPNIYSVGVHVPDVMNLLCSTCFTVSYTELPIWSRNNNTQSRTISGYDDDNDDEQYQLSLRRITPDVELQAIYRWCIDDVEVISNSLQAKDLHTVFDLSELNRNSYPPGQLKLAYLPIWNLSKFVEFLSTGVLRIIEPKHHFDSTWYLKYQQALLALGLPIDQTFIRQHNTFLTTSASAFTNNNVNVTRPIYV